MTETVAVRDALQGVGARVDGGMSEKDVENAFLNENFYELLGYEGAGYDLRSEWTLPDDRRPDYVTLDSNESVTAVYEFKAPGRDLSDHTDQLFHYVDVLKSDYGVLTNGQELRLFKRDGQTRMVTVTLAEVSQSDARDLEAALRKPEWDITDAESVTEFLDVLDAVSLEGELGQEHFFDTFRLEEGSPFADLVTAMMGLLQELRDERQAKFVKGAYDFWEASYANVPDDVPDSWEPFIDGNGDLHDFMFCLESGHALLGRLLLAKATEDHDFFPNTRGLERYFDELGGFDGAIDLDAYPIAANGMIDDMRRELVESLFEDDIFIWWTDGYAEQTASQHEEPFNRFRDVAKEGSEVTRVSPVTRERFSRAVAHVSFAVLKFDFSHVEGDPLGDLYQRYFDPETRKALGEFYTPQPVIDYIMDGVGYDDGVSRQRLIDPACGSGTFLVEAVNRYLDDVRRYEDDPDWAAELTELCSRPRVVGLDIHPFAVLMAQIRFMVTVLPEYKQAKRQDDSFTIHRLPIFRTDTLRNERELTGVDLGDDGGTQLTFDAVTEENQDVYIPVPLPIEVDGDVPEAEREGDFLVQRVRMPLFDNIRLNTDVRNFGEYFAALQGVLDVVKFHMSEDLWEYRGGLEEGIHRYTTREYEGIEEFFAPYVDDILDTVQYLRDEHGDGRLFKMFEDTVLALVVKNYMEYDYVVGNPPYVRKESIPSAYKESILAPLYPNSYSGNGDLYIYFIDRGLKMLSDGGKLSFITSIKFTKSDYGDGIRGVVDNESTIKEFSNFEMSNFFKDATAYPCIFVLENDDPSDDYQIPVLYAKEKPDDVTEAVREMRRALSSRQPVDRSFFRTYTTCRSDLDEREWRFVPHEANKVFNRIDETAKWTLSAVMSDISAGIKTGMNSVFLLDEAEIAQTDIEEELLHPIVRGSEIKRFDIGLPDEYVLYTNQVDIEDYPGAREYLETFKEKLADRSDGAFQGKEWYELNIPHSPDLLGSDKIICPDISDESNFAFDDRGTFILNTAYLLVPEDNYSDDLRYLTGLLNSTTLEFYMKQISPPLRGGYHRYITKYLEPLPLAYDDETQDEVTRLVDEIRQVRLLEDKIRSFPGTYAEYYDGELEYVDYTWQTRRYPVNADIQELADGRFAVTAGRSDEITDPLIDQGDREEKKLRATYVHAAVDGRKVKRGEETSIPIPASREGVEQMLDALEADRRVVEETSIDELEAEIDEAVYDLFDLTDEERRVIEDYLDVF